MKKTNGKSGKFANKRKVGTTTILLIVLLVVLLAVLVLLIAAKDYLRPAEATVPTEEVQTTPVMESIVQTETQATVPDETDETEETAPDGTESDETAPPETEEISEETEGTEPTKAPSTKPKPTTPTVTTPTVSYLNFPYQIPNTTLVIQKIDSYDGIFLEDGSDRDVKGIFAMVLKNTGTVGVEYANITLMQNGKELTFKATALPAGGTMVVQEASAATYVNAKFTECVCDVALLEDFEMSKDMVSVTENEGGGLLVTNLTGKTIPCIRVFYKFYMTNEKVYVGGITYTAKLTELAGGKSTVITPSHYMAGSSALVMVRTYETAD